MDGKSKVKNRLDKDDLIKIFKEDPAAMIVPARKYLYYYPSDYQIRALFIKALVYSGKIDEALENVDYLEYIFVNLNTYMTNQSAYSYFNNTILEARATIYAQQGRYDELMGLYKSNMDTYRAMRKDLKYFVYAKEGKTKLHRDNGYPYDTKQIIEYSEKDFLDYSRGLAKSKLPFELAEDFPLEQVADEVKKYIPSSLKIVRPILYEDYYFKYDKCGKINGVDTDYFKARVICNTDNIVKLLPVADIAHYDFVDLGYMKKQAEHSRQLVKDNKQINKFYSRYGMR